MQYDALANWILLNRTNTDDIIVTSTKEENQAREHSARHIKISAVVLGSDAVVSLFTVEW